MASHGASIRHAACLLALTSLAFTCASVAHADDGDNYAACLIGRAAVVLHQQDKKNSGKALEAAFERCKEPEGISEAELEGISDFASTTVEVMAPGLQGETGVVRTERSRP